MRRAERAERGARSLRRFRDTLFGVKPILRAPRTPIVGNLPSYLRNPLAFLKRMAGLGDVVDVGVPGAPLVLVSHPDLIDEVLVKKSKDFVKDRFLRDFKGVVGEGLLTSEGDFWKRQRRLAQPAFHRERLGGYADTMVECTAAAIDRWRDGEERDLHADMMRLTLEIVGRTLFGAELHDDAALIGDALEGILQRYAVPLALLVPGWDRLPTPGNKRFRRSVADVDAIVRRLVRGRLSGRTPDTQPQKHDDLLSMLIEARDDDGRGMTEEQLRDEALTLILAGHETTAIALSWTFVQLSRHPEVQARLGAELDEVLGGRLPRFDDYPKLVYAERVIQESMRLCPPAWSIGREPVRDVTIGDYEIAKGTQVWMAQWTMHRDARYWPRPEQFDPDRWKDGLAKSLHKFVYFPFGGGPRVCIGNQFAMVESVLLLATIAQKFRWKLTLGRDPTPLPQITLRPKEGVPARLERRKGPGAAAA